MALNRLTATLPQPTTNPTIQLKLPTLQIPNYANTDVRKWPQFRACFTHSVDERPLSTIDKFNCLLSYLEREALLKVAGYSIMPENYGIVKNALEPLRKSRAAQKEAVRGTPTMPPTKGMLDFAFNQIERIIGYLEQQSENVTDNVALESLIEPMLPKTPLLQICTKKLHLPNWKLENLRNKTEAAPLVRKYAAQTLLASFVRSTSPANLRAQIHKSSNKKIVATSTPKAAKSDTSRLHSQVCILPRATLVRHLPEIRRCKESDFSRLGFKNLFPVFKSRSHK